MASFARLSALLLGLAALEQVVVGAPVLLVADDVQTPAMPTTTTPALLPRDKDPGPPPQTAVWHGGNYAYESEEAYQRLKDIDHSQDNSAEIGDFIPPCDPDDRLCFGLGTGDRGPSKEHGPVNNTTPAKGSEKGGGKRDTPFPLDSGDGDGFKGTSDPYEDGGVTQWAQWWVTPSELELNKGKEFLREDGDGLPVPGDLIYALTGVKLPEGIPGISKREDEQPADALKAILEQLRAQVPSEILDQLPSELKDQLPPQKRAWPFDEIESTIVDGFEYIGADIKQDADHAEKDMEWMATKLPEYLWNELPTPWSDHDATPKPP